MSTLESRIAAEVARAKPINRMVNEMRAARYIEFMEDFEAAIELDDRFVFVAHNANSNFIVGVFFKATATRAAEYAAEPIAEHETEADAIAEMNAQA